MAAPPVKDRG